MGYELHISRPASWAVSDGDSNSDDWTFADDNAISLETWHELARSEPRLLDAGVASETSEGAATIFTWRDAEGPSFVWDDGRIDVKGVRSEREIAEIVELAERLQATVIGDDGETYDRQGRAE